jgi:serine/threonine-protein kinase
MKSVFTRTRLRTLTLGVGASAFAMACSFGSVEGDDNSDFTPVDAIDSEPVLDSTNTDVDPAVNPNTGVEGTVEDGATTGEQSAPSTTPANTQDPMSAMGDDYGSAEFTTDLAREAMGILELNCAGCHSNGVALGGVADILNFGALIDQGKLARGSREDSSVYTRMSLGTMPPASSTQRPDAGQIDLVGQFIDGLTGVETCEPLDYLSYDEMFDVMLQDVLTVDQNDRQFTRYLTASYSVNSGECGRDLERQKHALYKMINSVSLSPQIRQPVAVDQDETIFRIDIRDYEWDRQIDLNGSGILGDSAEVVLGSGILVDDADDGWRAIVDAVGEYAVEFEGDEADELKRQTGDGVVDEPIPFLPINAFVKEVTTGDLYYGLIDGRQNLKATELDLGVDPEQSIEDETFWRAGFSTSGVSKQERAVTRQFIGIYQGNYWLSQDFADNVGNDSLYSNPLDFEFNGGEAIYSLPNGLQAYYATDDDGNRVSEVPVNIVIDPAQNNGIVTNAASCHSCHNGGMIPFTDTVREYVLGSGRLQLDAQTIEDVQKEYLPVEEFNRVVEEDSERHLVAVERAGVPRGTADPVSRVFLKFQLEDLNATTVAGELGIPVDDMLDNLNILDPILAPLRGGGVVSREQFTGVYFDSICRMQVSSQNRPANCQ